MRKELEELNRFLREGLGLINQLSLPSVDEKKIVEAYRNALTRLLEGIDDSELRKYLKRELAEDSHDFWGEIEVGLVLWDARKQLPMVTTVSAPKEWFCWDVNEKRFCRTESRELIRATLYLRLYNLIGKFLERCGDGDRILAQQLMDLKNGLSLEYDLGDVGEILGEGALVDKAKEIASKLDLRAIEAVSLPLERMLDLASTPYYDVEVRRKLGDKTYLLPANLDDTVGRVRTLLTQNLCQIEQYATQAKFLRVRKCPRDVREKVKRFFMQRIEEKKDVVRRTVASLLAYVNQKLGELKVDDDWWEVEERFETLGMKDETGEAKMVRKPKKVEEVGSKALNKEAVLQVLEEGSATLPELERRLSALNYEFSSSELSTLITSLRSEGKIKLVPTPQGLKWELCKGP